MDVRGSVTVELFVHFLKYGYELILVHCGARHDGPTLVPWNYGTAVVGNWLPDLLDGWINDVITGNTREAPSGEDLESFSHLDAAFPVQSRDYNGVLMDTALLESDNALISCIAQSRAIMVRGRRGNNLLAACTHTPTVSNMTVGDTVVENEHLALIRLGRIEQWPVASIYSPEFTTDIDRNGERKVLCCFTSHVVRTIFLWWGWNSLVWARPPAPVPQLWT